MLKVKIDYYKVYCFFREKIKYNNIEYNVLLFFKVLDVLKK